MKGRTSIGPAFFIAYLLFLIFTLSGGANAQVVVGLPWIKNLAAAGIAGLYGNQWNFIFSYFQAVSPDVW